MGDSSYYWLIGTLSLLVFWFLWDIWLGPKARLKSRGEKMIEAAKNKGPLLTCNNVKNVTAVCPRGDFLNGIDGWIEAAEDEKDDKKRVEMKTGKMTVQVYRTFTFAYEQEKAIAHTGTQNDLEALADVLIEKVTGYRRFDVSEEDFESAMKILVPKDTRLFVPFSSMFRIEEQLKKWGGRTISDAQSALLHL